MVDERLVDVGGGVRLAVRTAGPADGDPVVLLAGAACSGDAWHPDLVAALARRRRVVVVDHRDSGRSTLTSGDEPAYALPDLAADVVAVLRDVLAPDERADLVGVSMGGSIAQLVALDHPDLVGHVVLVSCTPGAPGQEADDLPGPTLSTSTPDPDWADRESVVAWMVETERPYRPTVFDEDDVRATARETVARATDPSAAAHHYAAGGGPPWRPRLADLRVPVTVVHGDDDPMFPLPHARALAREIPGARLVVVPGSGHGVPVRRHWPAFVDLVAPTPGHASASS